MAFIKRHGIKGYGGDSAVEVVEFEIEDLLHGIDGYGVDEMEGKRLERLWKRIANQAIGDDGIDHGCVGHSVEG